MELSCRQCGAGVPAWRRSEEGIAWCGVCQTVFDCSAKDGPIWRRPRWITVEEVSKPSAPGYRGPAGPPEALGLRITRRWWGPESSRIFLASIRWTGFVVTWWLFGALSRFVLLLGVLPFVVIIARLTYRTAAFLFNQTTIEIDGAVLRVRHTPWPWPGARDVRLDGKARVRAEAALQRSSVALVAMWARARSI